MKSKIKKRKKQDKKISIRVVFPVVMSVSIAVCILSCMVLFSYYFSVYFQKYAIEKTGKQKNSLAQNLETEIGNINELMNEIYYQDIKKYDVESTQFAEEIEQRMIQESNRLYGLGLYDRNGKTIWQSETIQETDLEDVTEMSWFFAGRTEY